MFVQITCICLLQQEKDTDTFSNSRPTSRQYWANLITFVGTTSACYRGCSLLTGNVHVSLHYIFCFVLRISDFLASYSVLNKQQFCIHPVLHLVPPDVTTSLKMLSIMLSMFFPLSLARNIHHRFIGTHPKEILYLDFLSVGHFL